VRAVQINEFGGPDVLEVIEDAPVPEAGEHQVLVKVSRAGMNFADTHARENTYLAKYDLPLTPGAEVAGTDPDGNRVVALLSTGGYAEYAVAPKATTFPIPDGLDDGAALALVLQGLTAWHLYRTSAKIAQGESVVVHAAAGGVGSVLVPWARSLGATVIGTAGGPTKCRLARKYGCDHAIDYKKKDFVAEVKKITKGRGVDVVYDAVGKDTLVKSFDCTKRRGMVVTFGNASGKPPAIEPHLLTAKGSLYLTRPTLADYVATRKDLDQAADALFDAVRDEIVTADVRQRYALKDVAKAHADLEARKTTGTTLLIP